MGSFTIGLDLGQSRDYSAAVVTERVLMPSGRYVGWRDEYGRVATGPQPVEHFQVRHAQRWQLGTPYPAIVEAVGELLGTEPLGEAILVLDATGVGRGVVDMFNEAYHAGKLGRWWPVPITITGGQEAHGLNVPKQDLVAALQAPLQLGRLKVAKGLPAGDLLEKELLAFRAKITSAGNATYEAERERDHDDLVIALALSVWRENHYVEPRWVEPGPEDAPMAG